MHHPISFLIDAIVDIAKESEISTNSHRNSALLMVNNTDRKILLSRSGVQICVFLYTSFERL